MAGSSHEAYGKYLARTLSRGGALRVARTIVGALGADLPSDTAEVVAWLSRHGLGTGAGPGAVLAAVRADLHGSCTACHPTPEARGVPGAD